MLKADIYMGTSMVVFCFSGKVKESVWDFFMPVGQCCILGAHK